jgi:hypothetical protein
MTNDIAIRDDMRSVERWENEGGRVSPLNHLWASLKRFTTVDNSRDRQMIDARKSPQHQPAVPRYGTDSSKSESLTFEAKLQSGVNTWKFRC